LTAAEQASRSWSPSGWGWSTRGAASVVLVAYMLSGRGVWSNWTVPCMPALWLEHRVTEGVGSFTWVYSEAGAVLSGPSSSVLQFWSAPWERVIVPFAGFVAASAAGGLVDSGLHNKFGGPGFLVVFFVSTVVLVRALERRTNDG